MVTRTREQQQAEMAQTVDGIKKLANAKLEAERSLRERDGELAALRESTSAVIARLETEKAEIERAKAELEKRLGVKEMVLDAALWRRVACCLARRLPPGRPPSVRSMLAQATRSASSSQRRCTGRRKPRQPRRCPRFPAKPGGPGGTKRNS